MLGGLLFTSSYIIFFKFISPELNNSDNWLFGISPEGIGFLGMFVNLIIAVFGSAFSSKPPFEVEKMVDQIRLP